MSKPVFGEWVSVKDALPEVRFLPVLCFNGNAPEYRQHVYQANWFQQSKRFKPMDDANTVEKVTHWMPLPEPPKQ